MELDTPSSSLNYEEKKNQLFASLDTAGNSIIKGTILDQKPAKILDFNKQRTTRNKDAKSVYKFIGKESLFKKPEIPLEKCLKPRKSPDHKVCKNIFNLIIILFKFCFLKGKSPQMDKIFFG